MNKLSWFSKFLIVISIATIIFSVLYHGGYGCNTGVSSNSGGVIYPNDYPNQYPLNGNGGTVIVVTPPEDDYYYRHERERRENAERQARKQKKRIEEQERELNRLRQNRAYSQGQEAARREVEQTQEKLEAERASLRQSQELANKARIAEAKALKDAKVKANEAKRKAEADEQSRTEKLRQGKGIQGELKFPEDKPTFSTREEATKKRNEFLKYKNEKGDNQSDNAPLPALKPKRSNDQTAGRQGKLFDDDNRPSNEAIVPKPTQPRTEDAKKAKVESKSSSSSKKTRERKNNR